MMLLIICFHGVIILIEISTTGQGNFETLRVEHCGRGGARNSRQLIGKSIPELFLKDFGFRLPAISAKLSTIWV